MALVDVDYQGTLIEFKDYSGIDTYVMDEMDSIDESKYDFIVIDHPPYLTPFLKKLIEESVFIVIPTKIGLADFKSLSKIANLLKTQSQIDKSMILYTMVDPNPKSSILSQIEHFVADYGIAICPIKVYQRVSYVRGFLTLNLDKKAQREIDEIAYKILAELNK